MGYHLPNRPDAKIPDADFIKLVETIGPVQTARRLGVTKGAVHQRRRNLENYYRRQITAPHPRTTRRAVAHPGRVQLDILNGVVLIGSDAHLWPGPLSTAMRAFIKFAKERKPRAVILNGDVLDFPKVSRHPPIGWETTPDVADEIEAANVALKQIEAAVPQNCKLVWTLGNHDGRFETSIATRAPEFARVNGVHLKDHFNPRWQACWRADINDSVIVKHRFKGGKHAPLNGALWSGRTIVTGHLHCQKVEPLTDSNGDRWGVDTGCLADPGARAFLDYTEDNPLDWRAGFAVLTFVNGQLLPPELVTVWDDSRVVFRGELHEASSQKDKAAQAVGPVRGRHGNRRGRSARRRSRNTRKRRS